MALNSKDFSITGVLLLLISLTLIITFMYLLAINMKYIKELSYKIKIIMRAAFEKDSPLHKYKQKLEKSKINETSLENDIGNNSKDDVEQKDILSILKQMTDRGRSAKF